MSTWHAGSILGWAFLVLREGDPLKSTSCPEPLFSPWPYPMAFFQSGPWTGQCLHSWSPRLWSFYLFIYLVPFSHDPSLCHLIAETRLPLIFSCSSSSHHLNDELVSEVWGSAEYLPLLVFQSSVIKNWLILYSRDLLNWFYSIVLHGYQSGTSSSWGQGPENVRLLPDVWEGPHFLLFLGPIASSRFPPCVASLGLPPNPFLSACLWAPNGIIALHLHTGL